MSKSFFEKHMKRIQAIRDRLGVGMSSEQVKDVLNELTIDSAQYDTIIAFIEYAADHTVHFRTGGAGGNDQKKLITKDHLALLLTSFLEETTGKPFDISKHDPVERV